MNLFHTTLKCASCLGILATSLGAQPDPQGTSDSQDVGRARGILVLAKERGTIAEEMSEAYKDVSEVVEVMHAAGISRKVARLRPLAVIKG